MEIQKYDLRTDGRTDRQTWVGARDACASKNMESERETSYNDHQYKNPENPKCMYE